ncbi:hypothetical protein, partial [Actinomadura latina]|uniref:hypothetical protein n=1 Tax=Actinomadura latina TaxID=163603 RepID=UPI001C3F2B11
MVRWEKAVDVSARLASGDVDLGRVGVFEPVMPSAAEGEFVDVGGAVAEGPAVDVVDFAQGAGDLAALDCAGGVDRLEDLALGGAGESLPVSEVERDVA